MTSLNILLHIFTNACKHGDLNTLQIMDWSSINSLITSTRAFILACKYGHINIVEYLVENWPHINYYYLYDESAFVQACRKGQIHIVDWLLVKNAQLDAGLDADDKNSIFQCVCANGQILMAQKLYSRWKNLDVRANGDIAFIMACRFGHLQTARWLKNVDNAINHRSVCDFLFRCVYHRGNNEFDQWFISLYQINEIPDLINNIYVCSPDNDTRTSFLLQDIIRHFVIDELIVKPKFQEQFDLEIAICWQKYNSVKSAKKI